MTIEQIRKALEGKEYDFLRTNPHLGKNIVCLCLGGSHAYGTNIEGSDLDIRGVALNSEEEILLGTDFEQVVDTTTDTTIYSFKKMLKLLSQNNPNTIEMLGLQDWQIIYKTPIWDEVLKNRDAFISKKVINSFGGYANQQLRRLDSKSARNVGQGNIEDYIKGSIKHAEAEISTHYPELEGVNVYTDTAVSEDMERELFIDLTCQHYPLRSLVGRLNEYNNIIKDYSKASHRNENAIAHNKLGKHMMHLVRLYHMCFDILEKGEIITFRAEDHDELMSIRGGIYLNEDSSVKENFYQYVDALEARLKADMETTTLPRDVDYERINAILAEVNRKVISDISLDAIQIYDWSTVAFGNQID